MRETTSFHPDDNVGISVKRSTAVERAIVL